MMSYAKERDEFMTIAASEGLRLDVARKLMRYAQTLHRLAVAQCNGDYPYNGDRDRPSMTFKPCNACEGTGYLQHGSATDRPMQTTECFTCQGTGQLQTNGRERIRWDSRHVVCPKCELSGVALERMVCSKELKNTDVCTTSGLTQCTQVKVCPDCRTTELVKASLPEGYTAIVGGDPRGCVLKVKVPSGRTNDWGKEGICVPVRER